MNDASSDADPVTQRLEQLLESGGSVEDVCADRPDLIDEVRRRWREVREVRDHVDDLFPQHGPDGRDGPVEVPFPQVPGYTIEAELGRGGMGVVWRARQDRLQRTVAVKMLLTGRFASERELRRFQREAEYVAQLCHRHIVAVFDFGEVDGQPFYVMEFVDGPSLAQRSRAARMPVREAVELVATLARAIDFAHRNGIVHRDLKPSNILTSADGTVKVSDFGLALRLGADGVSATGAMAGTPNYMAPEQVAGRSAEIGPATDVYGLGTVLYELLTGRPPFVANSTTSSAQQVLENEPLPPRALDPRIPRDVETICLQCLRKEAHQRYRSALLLAEDLEAFGRGDPIRARPIGLITKAWRRARRRPGLAAAAVGCLLLGITLLGVALRLHGERTANLENVAAELAAVHELGAAGDWPRAREAIARAAARLPADPPTELRDRVATAREELSLVPDLEQLRAAPRLRLAGRVIVRDGSRQIRAAYSERLARYGFDDATIDEGAVASRVAATCIRPALLAAVDDWALHETAAMRTRLLAINRRVDPDPAGWRDRVRNGDAWDRPDELAALAAAANVATEPPTLLVVLASRLQESGGSAMPLLLRVVDRHPDDLWSNLASGMLMCSRAPEEAIRYFTICVALRPDLAAGHQYLGLALAASGRLAEGEAKLRRALDMAPNSSWTRRNLGSCLFLQGRLDDAAAEFERVLADASEFANARLSLAAVRTEQQRYDEARALLDEVEAKKPNDPQIDGFRGLIELRTGSPEAALARFERAAAANPTSAETWHNISVTLAKLGRNDDALAAAQKCVELEPKVARWYGQLGVVLRLTGRMKEAIAAHEEAVRLAPDSPQEHQELGAVLAIDWQLDAAIQVMTTGLRLTPDHTHLQGALAQALQASGRIDEAVIAVRKFAESAKGGKAAERAGRMRAATERLAAIVTAGTPPTDDGIRPEERILVARHHDLHDRHADAVRWYEVAFARTPQLTTDVRGGTTLHAAATAVRAAAAASTGEAAAGFRSKALGWLNADLRFRRGRWAERDADVTARRLLKDYAERLVTAVEFAPLRDAEHLVALPADERDDVLRYWADLAEWLRSVRTD